MDKRTLYIEPMYAKPDSNLIHRFTLNAKARCGAVGVLRFSTSGVGVTCPECRKLAADA